MYGKIIFMFSGIGILLALSSGMLYGIRNMMSKRITNDGIKPIQLSILYNAFGFVSVTVVLLVFGGFNDALNIIKSPGIFSWGVALAVLSLVSGTLQYWVFAKYPYSLVAPLYSLVPVLDIVMAFLIIGERISLIDALGILVIVAGAMFLNLGKDKFSKETVKVLFPVLINVILFSLLGVIQKKTLIASTPMVTIWLMYGIIMLLGIPILYKIRVQTDILLKYKMRMFFYMIVAVLALSTTVFSFAFLPVGISNALKNLTLPITVLVGSLVFGEGDLKSRLIGSGIITSGALVMGVQ
jgi:drug/metabolite transporter (DMT)-like permease